MGALPCSFVGPYVRSRVVRGLFWPEVFHRHSRDLFTPSKINLYLTNGVSSGHCPLSIVEVVNKMAR